MDYRIIHIGALSQHELWTPPSGAGVAHATCTLIRSGEQVILVDPGLPEKALRPRLLERAGLQIEQITDVFLTCFRPAHRWGLPGLTHARWWISEAEREQVGRSLVERFAQEQEPDAKHLLKHEIEHLQRCQPASDRLAPQVDLFPVPGYTPGACGLLLALSRMTVVIAGDAVPTQEHLEAGRVLRGAFDAEQAKESLAEVIEIADLIIPGHDNLLVNPTRRPF